MTILAQFVEIFLPRGGFAWRARFPQSPAKAISGPVTTIETKPSGDGLTQTDLLALRNALARDWARARARRDTRGRHSIENDLLEVTAMILAKGSCSE